MWEYTVCTCFHYHRYFEALCSWNAKRTLTHTLPLHACTHVWAPIHITNIDTNPGPVNALLTQINMLCSRLWLICLTHIPPRVTGTEIPPTSLHNLLSNYTPCSGMHVCVKLKISIIMKMLFVMAFWQHSTHRTVSWAWQTVGNNTKQLS